MKNEPMKIKRMEIGSLEYLYKLTSTQSPNKIKPPFKFRNANNPAVRKWLVDNNYDIDINNSRNLDKSFGIVDKDGCFWSWCDGNEAEFNKHYSNYPELTFNFVIESVSLDNSPEIAKLESELEVLNLKAEQIKLKIKELK